MNALAAVDVSRLAKLCGMFSSDHVGERAAAAAKADAMVRAAGLTWPDVLQPTSPWQHASTAPDQRPARLSPGYILAVYGGRLNGWERGFLTSLIRQKSWSDRQREVLDEIRARFV